MGFMRGSSRRQAIRIAAAAIVATALIGCGRKGDPLPPPDPNATVKPSSDQGGPTSLGLTAPANPPIAKPTGSFILDPLIK